MVSLLYAISFVSLFLSSVAAHGHIVDVTINGKKFTAGSVMRGNQNQNPNSRSSGNNLICNTGGKTSTQSFATANPGDSMTFNWRTWTSDRHPGYIETFLARCGDTAQACNGFNPTGKVWFKIQERGLMEPSKSFNGGNWATDQLKRDGNKFTMTLPRGLKKGGYIMRQNIVAMHLVGKPEFYPNCIHLSVGGSGTGVPSASQLVSIPGYLSTPEAQKALNFNIFAKYNSYTIAGPRPVTSFSSSGSKAAAAPAKETPVTTGSGAKDTKKDANPKAASTKPAADDRVECADDSADDSEAPKAAKPIKRDNATDDGTVEAKRDASETFVSGVQAARRALGSKHSKRRLAAQH